MSFDLGEELDVPALVVELSLDDELYPDIAITVQRGPLGEAVGELETSVTTVLDAGGEGALITVGLGLSVGGWKGDDPALPGIEVDDGGCCPGAPTSLIPSPPRIVVDDSIEIVTMLAHRI